MPTVEYSVTRLPLRKRELLEELAEAHRLMDSSFEHYGQMIDRCVKNGISFGQMGFVVDRPKESVWRSFRRYLERKAK